MSKSNVNILIIGGGFAGVECALSLAKKYENKVILISDRDYLEYYPAVFRVLYTKYESISRMPLERILPDSVKLVIDEAIAIDESSKTVLTKKENIYIADYIVLATGSQNTYYSIKGIESDIIFPFKSSEEAMNLRLHLDKLLDLAEMELARKDTNLDNNLLEKIMTFVVVGAGPAGCEIVANIARDINEFCNRFPRASKMAKVILIDSSDGVLPSLGQKFSDRVAKELNNLGIQLITKDRLLSIEGDNIILENRVIEAKTLIWASGVCPSNFVSKLDPELKAENGKLIVDDNLLLANSSTTALVYVVGDNADTKRSGLAQTAVYDGAFVARDIIARQNNCMRPIYKTPAISHIIPLDKGNGIFSIGNMVFGGVIGWAVRALADMMYLLPRVGVRETLIHIKKGL